MKNVTDEHEFMHQLMNLITQVKMRSDIINHLASSQNEEIGKIQMHSDHLKESILKMVKLSKERRDYIS